MTKQIPPFESFREIEQARRILSNSETVGVCTFFEASHFECRKTIFDVTKKSHTICTHVP